MSDVRIDNRERDPNGNHQRVFMGGWTDAVNGKLYATIREKKTHANMGNLFGWIFGQQADEFKEQIWQTYLQSSFDNVAAEEKSGSAAEWTLSEFDVLLSHSSLSDGKVAELLPGRSAGAIGVVRSGVHEFHQGHDSDILSKMMKARLKSTLVCAVCGQKM